MARTGADCFLTVSAGDEGVLRNNGGGRQAALVRCVGREGGEGSAEAERCTCLLLWGEEDGIGG